MGERGCPAGPGGRFFSWGGWPVYLKQMDILGFKSFADKVRLEFGPGVTAIVGPNGAGKSNIADAVRWVLGEQNPRELRGARMEDVIFGGSASKKPLGLAEVTLLLDNTDHYLPIDFTELAVGRRVDRSGAGEYLINRTSCRLRDVTGLVTGSGMGREAYSFIGQGRVEEILAGRPEERRPALEEAAGILRHKARKAEAMRLLDQAAARAMRLSDVLAELEANLAPLRQEAERAERREAAGSRLGELEAALLGHELRAMRGRMKNRQGEEARLAAELARQGEAAQQAGHRREEHRAGLEAVEGELDGLGRALAEAARAEERARAALERCREAAGGLAARRGHLEEELADLQVRREAWEARWAEGSAALARLAGETAAARQRVADLEARLSGVEGRRAAVASALRRQRDELFGVMSEAAQARNQAAAGVKEQALRERELTRVVEEVASLEATCARLEAELAHLAEEAAEGERSLADARARESQAAAERQELQRQAAEKGAELAETRDRLSGARSRLEALRELEGDYDGYAHGVRTVLRGRDRSAAAFRGVLGAVASLVDVPAQLERAVEVALGQALQNLVVETEDDAQRAIEQLKAERGGRATFLPLETVRGRGPDARDADLAGQPGAVGWAAGLVGCEGRLRPVVEHLLGRVLVARDLGAARTLARTSGYRYRMVTLEGEVIHPGGALTGGREGGRDKGLLSRAGEAGRLALQVEEWQRQGDALKAELAAIARGQQAAEAAWQAARSQAEAAARTLAEGKRSGEQAGARIEESRQRLALLTARREALELEAAGAATEGARWQEALEAAAGREEELRQALEAMEREGTSLESVREEASQQLTRARVELASLEQEERSRREAAAEGEGRGRELAAEVEARRQALTALAGEERQALTAEAAARAEAAAQASARERVEGDLAAAQGRRQALHEAWQTEERLAGEAREASRGLEEARRDSQVELARLEAEVANLLERLLGQHGLGEDAALALPALLSPREAREEVRRLRAEVEALGPANPAAIALYRAQRERRDTLAGQWQDLEETRTALLQLAQALDQRMEKLFVRGLEAVRQQFQNTFARLFGGGRADVVLVDPASPLTSGIEIAAQPPGKKLQHLSLLSGGERALTAIALVFALLKVRPVPFCVLDEIDAPLDEANVARFARFLREISREGPQFLVITHQKGTMEQADRLFGVTMDGSGASRLVSVRLAGEAAAVATVAG